MNPQPDPQPAEQPPHATGAARTYRVALTKVTSFVIMSQMRRSIYSGTLEQCEAAARTVMWHNVLLGWWGIPAGLWWTPVTLVRNAKAMRNLRSL